MISWLVFFCAWLAAGYAIGYLGHRCLDARRKRRDLEAEHEQLVRYRERTCCPTPWNTSHAGTCDNSVMRCGEQRWNVNERIRP